MTIVANESSYQLFERVTATTYTLTCIGFYVILVAFRRRNDVAHGSLRSPLLYILVGFG